VVLVAGPAVLAVDAATVLSQDIEQLGRIYGTRPPEAYFERIARDPGAFRFQRGWRSGEGLRSRFELLEGGRSGLDPAARAPGAPGADAAADPLGVLGRRDRAVEGEFRYPMVLGLYADSTVNAPYSLERVREQFIDGPNPTGTITEYYREVSGGRVELLGTPFDWIRSDLTSIETTGGSSGLGNSARVGEFIVDLLSKLDDGSIDWGQFDNDGPDGIPNSGDDDGFVDVLAVVHPTPGGECGGLQTAYRVWSHRWSLSSAFDVFVTKTPSNSPQGGAFIRVDDYTIQPVLACDGEAINEIGVFAHELGHGFGLPDLYAVGGTHAGIGQWGLMGSGSWGCQGTNPARPCHMSAWSKEMLGWTEVVELPAGADPAEWLLDPVESGGQVLKVRTGDAGDPYFLVENRQGLGFDGDLHAPGMLIWEVHPAILNSSWSSNRVNSNPDRQGVSVVQADGLYGLEEPRGNRGDAGDPFPGETENRDFHASSDPASRDFFGRPLGVTITDIELEGELLRFKLSNRNTVVTVLASGPDGLDVDVQSSGVPLAPDAEGNRTLEAAPFEVLTLDAVSQQGETEGVRVGFQGWEDGSGRFRELVVPLTDTTLVATFGGVEVRLDLALESEADGVSPGVISVAPESVDSWYPEGTEIEARAEAGTGFAFRDWLDGLAGSPNPLTLTLDAPATVGAAFDVTFGFDEIPAASLTLEAAVEARLRFSVANALGTVNWTLESGELPPGMFLDPIGSVRGFPLEVGRYAVTVRATDSQGLTASAPLTLDVIEPVIGAEDLVGPFLLTGGRLSAEQRDFLDRSGNGSGSYDLGDVRAYIQRNPDVPLTADLAEPVLKLLDLGPVGSTR
jgi:M6 family metalloprotease-like protein